MAVAKRQAEVGRRGSLKGDGMTGTRIVCIGLPGGIETAMGTIWALEPKEGPAPQPQPPEMGARGGCWKDKGRLGLRPSDRRFAASWSLPDTIHTSIFLGGLSGGMSGSVSGVP